jgi:predicted dehydrogenase
MLLPHLCKNSDVRLAAVATTTSLTAQNAKRKFGFEAATTNYQELIESEDIDAMLIATRHASHARLVAESLRAGKAVYVEKPLALTLDDLDLVRRAVVESGNDRLMVGFNRRFSPMINAVREQFADAAAPLVAHYRVHAGQLDHASWYLDRAEGTRFAGEAGHFLDVLAYLAGSRPATLSATGLRPEKGLGDDRENIVVTVQYENGSVGNLMYLTQGGTKVPKEHLEVFGGGQTAQLSNFESLVFFAGNDRRKANASSLDKGQKQELRAFVDSVKTGAPLPISLQSLFDTTLSTLAAETSSLTGARIVLSEFWQPRSG